jgi:hypothetical protein
MVAKKKVGWTRGSLSWGIKTYFKVIDPTKPIGFNNVYNIVINAVGKTYTVDKLNYSNGMKLTGDRVGVTEISKWDTYYDAIKAAENEIRTRGKRFPTKEV